MSARLAALAAQYVGRRVQLTTGRKGTITRVTSAGMIVYLQGERPEQVTVRRDEIARFLD